MEIEVYTENIEYTDKNDLLRTKDIYVRDKNNYESSVYNIKNIKKIYHEPIGETIPECIEIMIGKDTVAYIYSPIACHNYNTIQLGDKEINVATIDTMLSLYLAFIYADEYRFTKDRIMCMAQFLFDVEEQNRLEQKGLLKRFNMKCIGKQPGLDEIRNEKTMKLALKTFP